MEYNKTKFNWHELFNNTNGKTSGSAFIGLYFGVITGLAFISAMVGWFLELPLLIEVFEFIIQFGMISALLLGVRKVASLFDKQKEQ